MADVALVLLAGVLGAVVLAVVLLHRGQQKNRAVISQLNAQLAAQKIAALTQRGPTPLPAPEPEPARRKRHLSLFLGGGVAALLASLGRRARNAWRTHPAATVTATAAASAVAVVGAFAFTSGSDAAPIPSPVPASEPSHQAGAEIGEAPARDEEDTLEHEPADIDAITPAVDTSGPPTAPSGATDAADARAAPTAGPAISAPATRDEGEDHEGEPEDAAPSSAETATAPPTASPTVRPAPPEDPVPPSPVPDGCDGLGVKAPPVLELCLR